MLRSLVPGATFFHDLPGHDELPPDRRPRLVCRFLTYAQDVAHCAKVNEALKLTEPDRMNRLVEAVAMVVVAIENVPGASCVADLPNVLTSTEFVRGIVLRLGDSQTIGETDQGKSPSPRPGAAASSVASAGGGDA